MFTNYTPAKISFLIFAFLFLGSAVKEADATHAQGADLTYTCLGSGEYQIQYSFYRDCGGVAAPSSITVDVSSASCGQNLTVTLFPVAGTGNDITPICNSATTECSGGSNPGVEEYIYTGTITLPAQCDDWVFSHSVCCRNNAITTIQNPGNEPIYLEANLDNLNYPCNSSPSFSNPPVPYVCVGETYCFNHGAQDPDGDSLAYSLVAPSTGNNSSVTYNNGYSATQPVNSNPPMTIDPVTGDICFTPTQQEVTVMAVQVEEWRNGQLIGTIQRDIQVQVINCSNNLPYLAGINGGGNYSMDVCAGDNVQFNIPSFDNDASQNLSLSWNNGIPQGSFDPDSGASRPNGTFQWNTQPGDASSTPYCFTVTVTDDNCPMNGSQTYSFCIEVSGIDSLTTSATKANCGASNGSASVTVHGGSGNYSYTWTPDKGNNNSSKYNGISAGTYTIVVTDDNGCSATDSVVVPSGSLPGNLNTNTTNVSCNGGNDGSATVNVNGGKGPYSYVWSNGDTTQTTTGLSAGTYYVNVTTDDGCQSSDTITISEPAPVQVDLNNTVSPSCPGGSDGSATISASGGTNPYSYSWNTNPAQNGQTANNLSAGTYTVTVTDNNGCTEQLSVTINDPQPIAIQTSVTDVSCNGGKDGSASATASGGSGNFSYSWNTTPAQTGSNATNLGAGQYIVTATDQNGCSITDTVVVDQPTPLQLSMTAHQDVTCYNGEDGMLAVNASGGTHPYILNWVSHPYLNGNSNSNLSADDYIISVEDANGCTVQDTFSIDQPPQIQIQVDQISDVTCNGGNDGSATVSASGGVPNYSYQWDTNPPQNNSSAFNLSVGGHTVTITDANGCSVDTTIQIGEPAPVQVTAVGSDTICPGDNVTLTASATGGSGSYSFVWDQGLGVGASHTVSPGQDTEYKVTAYDGSGCPSEMDSVKVNVINLARDSFTVSGDTMICKGGSAQIQANYAVEDAGFTFTWNNGNNVLNGDGPHTVSPSQTTTYLVDLSDECDNHLYDSVTVEVTPNPVVNIQAPDTGACRKVAVPFENAAPTAASTEFLWKFKGGDSSVIRNPVRTFESSGSITAKLTLTNEEGCTTIGKKTIEVNVYPVPDAEFSVAPGGEVSIMDPEYSFHYNDPYAVDWTWDFGDGTIDSSNNHDPVHTYANTGEYPVKLVCVSPYGCKDTFLRDVVVKPEFTYYVPNAFTPDGDGTNDVFRGKGKGYVDREMMIFNRWGELIYESNSLENGWDGTVNGEMVKQDVYVYKIRVKDFRGKWHSMKGHVTVVR